MGMEDMKNWTLKEEILQSTGDNLYWLGGTDIAEEETWVGTSGRYMLNMNWREGEPNNLGRGEHCLVLYSSEKALNDAYCTLKHYYICEHPPIYRTF